MLIKVRTGFSYGTKLYYPENELAKKICKLLRVKSFTRERLILLTDLNYQVEITEENI